MISQLNRRNAIAFVANKLATAVENCVGVFRGKKVTLEQRAHKEVRAMIKNNVHHKTFNYLIRCTGTEQFNYLVTQFLSEGYRKELGLEYTPRLSQVENVFGSAVSTAEHQNALEYAECKVAQKMAELYPHPSWSKPERPQVMAVPCAVATEVHNVTEARYAVTPTDHIVAAVPCPAPWEHVAPYPKYINGHH